MNFGENHKSNEKNPTDFLRIFDEFLEMKKIQKEILKFLFVIWLQIKKNYPNLIHKNSKKNEVDE
jgi:hypothetical protein